MATYLATHFYKTPYIGSMRIFDNVPDAVKYVKTLVPYAGARLVRGSPTWESDVKHFAWATRIWEVSDGSKPVLLKRDKWEQLL